MLFAALGLSAAITVAGAASQTSYIYDALGRVAKITYSNGTVIQYQYDPAGNRVAKIVAPAAASVWGQFTWGTGTW